MDVRLKPADDAWRRAGRRSLASRASCPRPSGNLEEQYHQLSGGHVGMHAVVERFWAGHGELVEIGAHHDVAAERALAGIEHEALRRVRVSFFLLSPIRQSRRRYSLSLSVLPVPRDTRFYLGA